MLKTTSRSLAAIVATIALASSCTSTSSPVSDADAVPNPSENATDLLSETMTQFVDGSFGGVEVLRRRNGVTQHTAVGTASIDGQQLLPGRVFRVGSLSKTFVAVMVLQLVDDGIVDLDTMLGEYLPDTAIGADVTIRQLLSHQSGIPDYTDQPEFFADVLADRSRRIVTAEIVA